MRRTKKRGYRRRLSSREKKADWENILEKKDINNQGGYTNLLGLNDGFLNNKDGEDAEKFNLKIGFENIQHRDDFFSKQIKDAMSKSGQETVYTYEQLGGNSTNDKHHFKKEEYRVNTKDGSKNLTPKKKVNNKICISKRKSSLLGSLKSKKNNCLDFTPKSNNSISFKNHTADAEIAQSVKVSSPNADKASLTSSTGSVKDSNQKQLEHDFITLKKTTKDGEGICPSKKNNSSDNTYNLQCGERTNRKESKPGVIQTSAKNDIQPLIESVVENAIHNTVQETSVGNRILYNEDLFRYEDFPPHRDPLNIEYKEYKASGVHTTEFTDANPVTEPKSTDKLLKLKDGVINMDTKRTSRRHPEQIRVVKNDISIKKPSTRLTSGTNKTTMEKRELISDSKVFLDNQGKSQPIQSTRNANNEYSGYAENKQTSGCSEEFQTMPDTLELSSGSDLSLILKTGFKAKKNSKSNKETNTKREFEYTNNTNSSCAKTFVFNTPLDEYKIIKNLGKGSYGRVILMRNTLTQQVFAVKVVQRYAINKDDNDEKKHKVIDKRILREANLSAVMGKITPHIVPLYDFKMTKTHFYLFYEHINGPTLAERVGENGIDEKEAKQILRPLVETIALCHKNFIVHRDIKLENILIDYSEAQKLDDVRLKRTEYKHKRETSKSQNLQNNSRYSYEGHGGKYSPIGCVKLIDFGLANFYKLNGPLDTFCGSMPYTAPEILKGEPYSGPEIDIWSLGVLLYVMLTGKFPFSDPTQPKNFKKIEKGEFKIYPNMSQDVVDLLQNMIQPNKTRRYNSKQILNHRWFREESLEIYQIENAPYSQIDSPLKNARCVSDVYKEISSNEEEMMGLCCKYCSFKNIKKTGMAEECNSMEIKEPLNANVVKAVSDCLGISIELIVLTLSSILSRSSAGISKGSKSLTRHASVKHTFNGDSSVLDLRAFVILKFYNLLLSQLYRTKNGVLWLEELPLLSCTDPSNTQNLKKSNLKVHTKKEKGVMVQESTFTGSFGEKSKILFDLNGNPEVKSRYFLKLGIFNKLFSTLPTLYYNMSLKLKSTNNIEGGFHSEKPFYSDTFYNTKYKQYNDTAFKKAHIVDSAIYDSQNKLSSKKSQLLLYKPNHQQLRKIENTDRIVNRIDIYQAAKNRKRKQTPAELIQSILAKVKNILEENDLSCIYVSESSIRECNIKDECLPNVLLGKISNHGEPLGNFGDYCGSQFPELVYVNFKEYLNTSQSVHIAAVEKDTLKGKSTKPFDHFSLIPSNNTFSRKKCVENENVTESGSIDELLKEKFEKKVYCCYCSPEESDSMDSIDIQIGKKILPYGFTWASRYVRGKKRRVMIKKSTELRRSSFSQRKVNISTEAVMSLKQKNSAYFAQNKNIVEKLFSSKNKESNEESHGQKRSRDVGTSDLHTQKQVYYNNNNERITKVINPVNYPTSCLLAQYGTGPSELDEIDVMDHHSILIKVELVQLKQKKVLIRNSNKYAITITRLKGCTNKFEKLLFHIKELIQDTEF
ncbi:putative serine/threonine-protein kinase KIN1-like protein [Zancudomyces culisetae]|uniref:Putative serine/threonine-protein kinase KIN1-like protein n=1 Tax=Zancudomyces culisetae TaxID=1213189 RepID=A0A1R1PXU9_ZANCU|nr:putative serine/threonine-protein kinase KIN1-like protein [Zancudomyces culisetae]|eukprot:OMH85738.1 putative serine/threonine-protein kinase KIN1-like protein [Zancudomyces culisetae]